MNVNICLYICSTERESYHVTCVSLPMQHYKGVKYGFVSPYDLANCDVVLVSYETLSLELNYAKSHEGQFHTILC